MEELADELFESQQTGQPPLMGEALSVREREVLKLVAEGASNKEIAALLSISIRTVENHRATIMRKLNIKNTAHLTKYAIRKGYTSPAV